MTSITPVPTTRASEVLVAQQLLTQLRTDQTALLKLQTSISTGRRILLPSEDAPAALRAMSLQRLLERKAQIKINLSTSQSYLTATDTALSNIANQLAQARGTAVGVSGAASSDVQRQTAATEIQRTIQELVNTGNSLFRGRYLFAGSQTDRQPFELVGEYVRFNGNENDLQSFADLDQLFETNAPGNDVFGALSQAVQGTVDLNPNVTRDTRLAELNGGVGISRGSVSVSDGINRSLVDLSGAETVGDVIDLLEANPPAGRTLKVTLGSNNLNLSLDLAGGGDLVVSEVGEARTAGDLGLVKPVGVGTGPLVGDDLDPRATRTTPLRDLLGVRATATLVSNSANNDLVIEARRRGPEFNGLTVSYLDDGSVVAGAETVTYDPVAKTAVVRVQTGATNANHIRHAFTLSAAFSADYSVELDDTEGDNNGTGVIQVSATTTTAGGSGIELDLAHGLQVTNGGQTYNIDLSTAETVEDLLNALNGSPASLLAQLNADGTGLNVRSRLSGADFSVGENGGQLATQLGLRTFGLDTRLADLNHGLGVHSIDGDDFVIERKDGGKIRIDLGTAKTIGDVINLINNHPDNQSVAHRVTAQLAEFGNGIELVTSDPSATTPFAVARINLSQAAEDLGLIPRGADRSDPATSAGGVERIAGRDSAPLEVKGVFNSLLRLRGALETNNSNEISRTLELLDDAAFTANFTRSEIGARQQGLDAVQQRLESEVIELSSALSLEIEVDLPQAISELATRQAFFEASLKMVAQTQRMTILDFI